MSSRITRISSVSRSVTDVSTFCASSLNEGSSIARENLHHRLKQWKEWLWGTNFDGRRVFMGRPLVDCFFLLLAYTVFLAALTAMGVVFMGMLFWLIHWNFPTLQGTESLLQAPGIGFRPQPNINTNTIRFKKGDSTTYTHYIDQLDAFLKNYENQNQQGESFIDCNEVSRQRTDDLDKVCRFDLMQLGLKCVKQLTFGYFYGQPCVLLKLNKVFDWMPEAYINDTVPDVIRYTEDGQGLLWSEWWVTVTCEGETATDRENIGPLIFYPANGFHFKYFPFRNQQAYRSPLVFVRFDNIHPGILVMVTCKAWARNIQHDAHEMSAMVHFEIMVD